MRPARIIFGLIAASLLVHVVCLTASLLWLSEWRWVHIPAHVAVEMSGATIAFFVAIVLLSLERRGKGTQFSSRIAAALVGMGTLDGLHALTNPGQEFVWLHSLATFVGGLLFALVWLPRPQRTDWVAWWPTVTLSLSLLLGLGSLAFPQWVPLMVEAERFSFTAHVLNNSGGVLLLSAAIPLYLSYRSSGNVDNLLFCLHCTLFGAAATMFGLSALWDLPWWGWHVLRLLAYGVALVYVLRTAQGLYSATESITAELERSKRNLEVRVTEISSELQLRSATLQTINEDARRTNEQLRQSSAELAREQFLLNTLVENIPDPIFFKDREHRFIRVNRIMAEDTGLSDPRDLIGKTDSEIWAGEFGAETFEDERRIMTTGEPLINKEEHPVNQAGQERWVLVTKMPLRDQHGEIMGLFGIARDITERKQQEQERERFRQELERSNQELESFAYVASHDLRTPLRNIDSLTQWILEDAGDVLPPASREDLQLLRQRVALMHRLLNDLLQYSRIGRAESAPEELNPSEVIREVVELLAPASHVNIVFAPDMPTVWAPRTALRKVFQNLIDNALKHHGGASPRIGVAAHDFGDYVQFTVSDNGPGIDPRFHEKVFQLFQTLQRRDDGQSSGMGLAIVKKTIELYGGRVWVESQEGAGANFHFTWPRERID